MKESNPRSETRKKGRIRAASPGLLRELASLGEFDIAASLAKELRRARWREGILLGLLVLVLFFCVVLALRPPYVIDRDRPVGEQPQAIIPGEPPAIDEHDVAKFFIFTQRLRYGWDSATIVRDFEHLQMLMTKTMRKSFLAYVNGVPEDAKSAQEAGLLSGETHATRVQSWITEKVVNQISLTLADVDCRKGQYDQWYCRARGFIETTPLLLPVGEAVIQRRAVEFRARYKEAPYFKDDVRIWGLGIAYLDAVNVNEGA